MRKNRRVPKRLTVVAANTMRVGAILLLAFVMVILNLLASSSCSHLLKRKGEMEREIASLDNDQRREATSWEQMTTPDRVEKALISHGLAMKLPRPDQTVRMRSDGTPYPGQLALSRVKRRMDMAATTVSRQPAQRVRRRSIR